MGSWLRSWWSEGQDCSSSVPVEYPTAAHLSAAGPLTSEQVASWRERGFVLVDGLLPSDAIDAAVRETRAWPPGPLSRGHLFPSTLSSLNDISIHPRLRAAVAQLLGHGGGLQLLQSETWSKTAAERGLGLESLLMPARYSNNDQRIHMDYPNHYLTHPSTWDAPEAVAGILYLDDADACGGATRVVPRLGPHDEAYRWPYVHMPGVGGHAWINDRKSAEQYYEGADPEAARFRANLYAREVSCHYTAGTMLLYRFDTWHRGTPLKPGGPSRSVLNFVYAKDGVRHITPWNCRLRCQGAGSGEEAPEDAPPSAAAIANSPEMGFARSMYFGNEDRLNGASVAQRSALGVPPPGDAYWSSPMRRAIAARFPTGDWRAYTDAPRAPL